MRVYDTLVGGGRGVGNKLIEREEGVREGAMAKRMETINMS